MEAILTFFAAYGWQLTLIAVLGIVILGILKYANVFKSIDKDRRKILYFVISIGFSLIASAAYLALMGAFTLPLFSAIAAAIYALNQTIYAIYETTSLRDLWIKIFDFVIDFLKQKKDERKEK